MKKKYLTDFASLTDVGKIRVVNQDQAQIVKNNSGDILMIVADGMGGHNRGDYASKTTVDFVINEFQNKKFFFNFTIKLWLKKTLKKINKILFNINKHSKIYYDTGTTAIIAIIHKNKLTVINIGDSRAYLQQENKNLVLLTKDQSYVNFLKHIQPTKEDEIKKNKNVLLNALGIYPSVMFNIKSIKFTTGTILLCSDGLYNNLNENEMINILNNGQNAMKKVCDFIEKVNANNGDDNIAVALLIRKNV